MGKSKIETRSSPQRIYQFISMMNDWQKSIAGKYGFGSFVHMKDTRLNFKFIEWILQFVMPTRREVQIGPSKCIELNAAMVQRVLGIPRGENKVQLKGSNISEVRNYFTRPNGESILIKDAVEKVLNETDEASFIRGYLMVLLSSFLCPSTRNKVNSFYLNSLLDVDMITGYNWCEHVLECLLHAVMQYQENMLKGESTKSNFSLNGCLYLLPAVYFDHLDMGSYQVSFDLPRISFLGGEEFDHMFAVDKIIESPVQPAYGRCSFREHGLIQHAIDYNLKDACCEPEPSFEQCQPVSSSEGGASQVYPSPSHDDQLCASPDSFEKKMLHLQKQEEAMLARSNSMHTELSILVEKIDATNRSSLAAESTEKEELLRQLDATSKLNEMFKDSMHEELNLLLANSSAEFQINNSFSVNDVTRCSEFELYKSMANYRTELIMVNTISKGLESLVVASALKQCYVQLCQMAFQIDELQKERVKFIEVLEGMKTEITLGRIEQELRSVALYSLDDVNSKLMEDLENMKQSKAEVMEDLHAANDENLRLRGAVCSLEASITSLQRDLDSRTVALAEVECSHAGISKELGSKAEIIELGIARENALRAENDSLKHELLEIVGKKEAMVKVFHFMLMYTFNWNQSTNMDVEKLFGIIEGYLSQISDQAQKHICEQLDMVSKFSSELELIEVSVEKLRSENSFLQSELVSKNELSNSLLFDLSLLEELVSNTKDQADKLNELTATIESLEDELASKSQELDEAASEKQLLEEELSEKLDKLNTFYAENTELKSHMGHVEGIRCAIEEELADKKEVTQRLEEELIEMRTFLDERDCYIENLRRDLAKLLDQQRHRDTQVIMLEEKLEMAQALADEHEAIAIEARQVAEERNIYAEEKDEKVMLLDRSIEELKSTVFALEIKVAGERNIYAEEKDEKVKLLERSIEELKSTVFALEIKFQQFESTPDAINYNSKDARCEAVDLDLLKVGIPSLNTVNLDLLKVGNLKLIILPHLMTGYVYL